MGKPSKNPGKNIINLCLETKFYNLILTYSIFSHKSRGKLKWKLENRKGEKISPLVKKDRNFITELLKNAAFP